MNISRAKHYIAWYLILRGRGASLLEVFQDYLRFAFYSGGISAFTMFLGFPIKIPYWFPLIFPLIYEIAKISLALLDKHKLKIWQKQNEIATRDINPYFQKIEKSLDDLYEIVGTKKERRT